jgi:hypothetical protein
VLAADGQDLGFKFRHHYLLPCARAVILAMTCSSR